MSRPFEADLLHSLRELEEKHLLRKLRTLDSPQRPSVRSDGVALRNFSSNDYLGLADHPALREAACEEWERGGFGAGASRLICGTLAAHERLESALADFKSTEAALTFSSGYAAAMGAIPALCGKGDVLILDKLCHACLVDAARLSGAEIRVFPHHHLEKLESHLRWAREKHPDARVMILAESVYSMDGDIAPLREMVELKDRYGAWFFLDEAHGVGLLGRGGRGLAELEGVADRIEVQMGTLGKALGAHGAYLAGSRVLRDFLINRARSFIYSTAPPAPVAAAATRAIQIVAGKEGEALRSALFENLKAFAAMTQTSPSATPIVPWVIGNEETAMEASRVLLDKGLLVPAIRYPTVARGTARLRITFSASHTPQEIGDLANALRSV